MKIGIIPRRKNLSNLRHYVCKLCPALGNIADREHEGAPLLR